HMTPRHCALFLLSRRPPASTLFPYTTLFRSKLAVLPDDPTAPGRIAVDVICHEFHPLKGKRLHLLEAAFFFFFSAGFISSKPRIDRKSTRLNSSHVKISYAVFCVKKKKQVTN